MLVVKDPPGGLCAQVPGVLGMNILRRCYQELFGQHGMSLFDLPVVSQAPSSVFQALQHCHHIDSQGVERTTRLVQQRCYWPGMSSDIARWCQECERCQCAKGDQPAHASFMGHLLAARPNEILALDFTLLEPSSTGLENVLVMTDIFTKYTLAVPTRDQ